MINFYKVTVFLVVLVLEPVFAADECQNLQEALQSSEKLMSQNDYQMAADLLDDILSKCKTESTTLAEVLSYRGGISNRMGKYEKAIYFSVHAAINFIECVELPTKSLVYPIRLNCCQMICFLHY